jgi:hypothetical protein
MKTTLPIVKTCSCGKRYTSAQWRRLPYVGVLDLGDEILEHRNCPCGSTIVRDVSISLMSISLDRVAES